jgi:hypothetical protein
MSACPPQGPPSGQPSRRRATAPPPRPPCPKTTREQALLPSPPAAAPRVPPSSPPRLPLPCLRQEPQHVALVALVEAALAVMRLSCEKVRPPLCRRPPAHRPHATSRPLQPPQPGGVWPKRLVRRSRPVRLGARLAPLRSLPPLPQSRPPALAPSLLSTSCCSPSTSPTSCGGTHHAPRARWWAWWRGCAARTSGCGESRTEVQKKYNRSTRTAACCHSGPSTARTSV